MSGEIASNGTFLITTPIGAARVHPGDVVIEHQGKLWSRSPDEVPQLIDGFAIGLVRTNRRVKIVLPPPAEEQSSPNASLLKLVAQAFTARAEIDKGGSFGEVAARLGQVREIPALRKTLRDTGLFLDDWAPTTRQLWIKNLINVAFFRYIERYTLNNTP